MKIKLFAIAAIALGAMSCGGGEEKEVVVDELTASEQQEVQMMEESSEKMDAVTTEMKELEHDLEESLNELDNL